MDDAPRQTRQLTKVSAAAAVLTAVIGTLVLVGWMIGSPTLQGAFGTITMKTNTSLGFIVGAGGLLAYLLGLTRLATVASALVTALGALTFSEHLFGWDLGIDQALFTEPPGALATASPNRMGPNGALSFTLVGATRAPRAVPRSRARSAAQGLVLASAMLALLAIAGYLYRASELYAIAAYTGIAWHTAVAFLILDVGILAARVDVGPMAVLLSEGPAGAMLRRLAAPVVLVPLALGYAVILGREAGYYERGFSIAFFAVSVIVVLGAVVWRTAQPLADADGERRQAERERDQMLLREKEARDQAERANRLKDQFIAVLSHELRTPLNVILGWTHVLENETTPERHARAAAIVARNGRILTRLVEDLLDLSRVSSGQLEIARRPIPFNPIVQAACDAFAPAARAKGLSLVVTLDDRIGTIDGDGDRLQQVVSNLLSNAIKFTPGEGAVHVTTRSEADGGLVLTVSDTGIGFDSDFAASLFEPFRQADSSYRREYGGLGLGLSIARHIVERHGGTLAGESAGAGTGATFTLRLPAPARRAVPTSPMDSGAAGSARPAVSSPSLPR
jgi:signal transduction histidine kinase